MKEKEIEQLRNDINKAISKALEDNHICAKPLKETIERSADNLTTEIYKELILPKNVFIDCSSPKDANILIEILYNEFSSTKFYVGNMSNSLFEAKEKVMKYMKGHNILNYYTVPYQPSFYMRGYFFHELHIKRTEI